MSDGECALSFYKHDRPIFILPWGATSEAGLKCAPGFLYRVLAVSHADRLNDVCFGVQGANAEQGLLEQYVDLNWPGTATETMTELPPGNVFPLILRISVDHLLAGERSDRASERDLNRPRSAVCSDWKSLQLQKY